MGEGDAALGAKRMDPLIEGAERIILLAGKNTLRRCRRDSRGGRSTLRATPLWRCGD